MKIDVTDFIDGLNQEVEAAKRHREWVAAGSKGMSAPFHGDFASALPSTLSRLTWWMREICGQRDKLVARIEELERALQHERERAAYAATGRDDFNCECGECFSCGHHSAYDVLRKNHMKE